MGNTCDKHSVRKEREKSKKTMNNVMLDSRNPVSSARNVSTLPPIRSENNKKTEHEVQAKSRRKSSSITPTESVEVVKFPACKKAEEAISTLEGQGYKGEHKQQGHKANEGIGHNSQIHNAAAKTSFLHVEAGTDFQDRQKKRESDTAKRDVRDSPNKSKNDMNSANLEKSVMHEVIVSAERGRSNDQRADFEAVKQTRENDTARVDGMSNTNGSKKDARPSHSRNEDEEKGSESLNVEHRTEDIHKRPVKKNQNKRKMKDLEDHVTELTEEKNKLLNRLSEVGAMKLINNNPNITDLSDANRPEKLQEQFSELYDNEWTDAYEHLTKKQAKPVDESVNLLLQALKEAYKICLSSTTKRAIKLRKAMLSYAGLSDEDSIEMELLEIEKKMSEYRHKMSQRNVTRLGKVVRERLRDQLKQLETEASTSVSLYIDGCVCICWYMCIKKPPMHLDFGENEKSTTADKSKPVNRYFNKKKFMSYTKYGDYIDYVVWPALFLHDNGPIMKKGVAQGTPDITNVLLDVIEEN